RAFAPDRIGTQKHLAVGLGREHLALGAQLLAQLDVIVDLAVEDQLETAIGRCHGLMAALSEIDDCQPAMAERDWAGGALAHLPPAAVGTTGCDDVDARPVRRHAAAAKKAPHR